LMNDGLLIFAFFFSVDFFPLMHYSLHWKLLLCIEQKYSSDDLCHHMTDIFFSCIIFFSFSLLH